MDNSFEIIVFENRTIYDTKDITTETCIEDFINMCTKYIDPKYVSLGEVDLDDGKMFIIFSELSEDDKPMMIMLIGKITKEIFENITTKLEKIYK